MPRLTSFWCRSISVVSLLSLCFGLVVPALWTMRCVGRDRVTLQWGQAKECQAPLKDTGKPAVRMHCCSFESVKSNVEQFTWNDAAPQMVLPVFICELWCVEPIPGSFADEVVHYAHGPPLACCSRSLLANGQLRV
jgi:hypothetical protein